MASAPITTEDQLEKGVHTRSVYNEDQFETDGRDTGEPVTITDFSSDSRIRVVWAKASSQVRAVFGSRNSPKTTQERRRETIIRKREFLLKIMHGSRGMKAEKRVVEDCPKGYPRLAGLLDSDENFMLYRRFGFVQARLLLFKQDQIRELEEDLDHLDGCDEQEGNRRLSSREIDDADSGERNELLEKLEKKFKEYADLLILSRNLASFTRPQERDYASVRRYFDNEDPLCFKESYIYCSEDIVTLKPGRESTWLDSYVERTLQRIRSKYIRNLFVPPDLSKKTNPDITKIILYSRERMNMVISSIILTTILALLIIPVYILWHLASSPGTSSTTAIIITIFALFTLLFSLAISKFTSAKRQEILGAAAAYCAVLVVFVGNVK